MCRQAAQRRASRKNTRARAPLEVEGDQWEEQRNEMLPPRPGGTVLRVLHSIARVCAYEYETRYVICIAYFFNIRLVGSDANKSF